MYQNYNYYPQNANQQISQQSFAPYLRQAPPQTGLKGRPVSSLEEVRAASIDFDGSIFYFPDLANKRIYTKQINMDGTATFNIVEEISLAIAIDGEAVPATTMIVTPAAVEQYFNVKASVFIDVPRGCCSQVSVLNTSTQPILVQNGNLIITREA